MRRDLQNVKSELRGSKLIFSIPLRKDFARKPAYWVEVYRTTHPTAKFNRYFMVRQWAFVKSDTGETIRSETIQKPTPEIRTALRAAKQALEAKIEAQWLLCEDQFDRSPPIVEPTKPEATTIVAYTADWSMDLDKSLKNLNISKKDLPRSVKFKEAQRKRRAKAEW